MSNAVDRVSIVLATYNWPEALDLCLKSLTLQTNQNFEVLIADDGSSKKTADLISVWKRNSSLSIQHLWQEDAGFRKARILNRAINAATGNYLVFLDGDCFVQPDFIAQHIKLAEFGAMVTGSRILLAKNLTRELCDCQNWSFEKFKARAVIHWINGQMSKWMPLFIKLPRANWRGYSKFVWRRIKGCNMACWKQDAIAIQGFDESLVGWGHEDADFVFRLHTQGIRRISGAWATEVFHLWHKMSDKATAEKNAEIVRAKILEKSVNKVS